MKSSLTALLFLAALSATAGLANAEVIVIAHPGVKADSVSQSELRDVFNGVSTSLKDGSHVKPVLLKEGNTHSEFLSKFLGESQVRFLIGWRGLVMSGQNTMPRTVDSEASLVDYIARTPGTIGYIAGATGHDGVKVLQVR